MRPARRLARLWAELTAMARPAVDYVLPIKLLGDWRDIPKSREDRRAGQHHRFTQLQKFAERVFEG